MTPDKNLAFEWGKNFSWEFNQRQGTLWVGMALLVYGCAEKPTVMTSLRVQKSPPFWTRFFFQRPGSGISGDNPRGWEEDGGGGALPVDAVQQQLSPVQFRQLAREG